MLQTKIEIQGNGLAFKILAKAGRQVAKMISLIDGFLNVSRLEAGRINIQPAILDLAFYEHPGFLYKKRRS